MRLLLLLCLLFSTLVGFGQQTSTPLEQANQLFEEKSYQLALANYQKLLSRTGLSGEQKREATYKVAYSLYKLSEQLESNQYLERLVARQAADVWAGRAHWMLEPALAERGGYYGDSSKKDALGHLRAADQILSRLNSPDLVDFYKDVVSNAIERTSRLDQKDRAYLFSFYDRLIPLLKDQNEVAEVLLRRANQQGYVSGKPDPKQRLKELRSIVSEFSETPSAPNAQMQIAKYYVDKGELKTAVAELGTVKSKWPESEEAAEAGNQINVIAKEQVSFELRSAYLPDEPLCFELRTRNTSRVKVTVMSFDPAQTLRSQRKQSFKLNEVSGPTVFAQTLEFEPREDYLPTTTSVELNFHKPGAYVLKVDSGKAWAQGLLLISDLMLVSNSGSTALEFWAVDAKTGKPRPSTQITLAYDYGKESKSFFKLPGQNSSRGDLAYQKFDVLRCDGNGFADFTKSDSHAENAHFAVAQDGANFAFTQDVYWHPQRSDGENAQGYIYTDRPVYRPNQSVYWRAILRGRKQGSYQNLAGQSYDVEIRDRQGKKVFSARAQRANEYGCLSGELKLGERPSLGQYSISISQGDKADFSGEFRVEEYKKPEYEVSVSTADKLFRMGAPVKAKVEAKYYFGAPVTQAQVSYTVRRRPHWFAWWGQSWGGSGSGDLGWFQQDKPESGPRHASEGEIVATGEGQTDAAGNLEFQFAAKLPPKKDQAESRGYWCPPSINAYDFQIEVTVTDKSRRNIDASQTVVVSDRALQVRVCPEKYLYSPGDMVKAELEARNLNDEPLAASGTLYVEQVRWLEPEMKEEVTTLSAVRADVDASGKQTLSWRVPAGQAGRLRFLFIAKDPFGGKTQDYGEFTVADENTRDVFYRYQGVEIIADKDTYEVGETARLMILNEFRDAVAWYWIDSGSGNLEKRAIALPERTNFVSVPITEGFVPNSMIHVVLVRDKKVFQDQKELIVPPKRKVLNVAVHPDKSSYSPGEQGTVEIVATDYEGKPVRGEFSLAMFDKSVTYIASDQREDIRRFFYGEKRSLANSNIVNSFGFPGRYNVHQPMGGEQYLFLDPQDGWDGNGYKLRFHVTRSGEDGNTAVMPAMAMAAPPAPCAMAPGGETTAMKKVAAPRAADSDEAGEELAPAQVRSDFRDAMFWSPTLVTDARGRATAKVTFPDSLTTWRTVAIGATRDTLVGNISTDTLVKKNLLVRLEMPRFLRERDQVVLSAIVHSYLSEPKQVVVRMKAEGLAPETEQNTFEKTVTVAPEQEVRVDWTLDAKAWGEAKVHVEALSDTESDAVEMKLPVLAHGIDKFVAWNGSSFEDLKTTGLTIEKNAQQMKLTQEIEIPSERVRSSSRLTVLVNPSLASAIREAIPYLIDYPYGCVEQTMSRFMPAVVATQTFTKLNIPRDEALSAKLNEVTRLGLERLKDFQHGDGGWGWWKGDDSSDYMTAYVMHGLTLARQAGVRVEESMFADGMSYLAKRVANFKKPPEWDGNYGRDARLNGLCYQLFVLALNGQQQPKALEYVWGQRDKLSAQSLAMLARTVWHSGRKQDALVALRNLQNFAVLEPQNNTVRWGRLEEGWYWWDDAVESTAQGLMAYLEIKPEDPMAAQAMEWLVMNRKGNRWKSTRDSAQAVLALSAYMLQTKENLQEMKVEVKVGDLPAKSFRIDADSFWKFDGKLVLEGDAVPEGKFPVVITKTGGGTLFYSIYAEYFSLEEGIKKAGNEIYVERSYEKVVREKVNSADGVVEKEKYLPVKEGDTLGSGDELRVTLRIKALNDYEYLVFEDPKPAGMEPVALQSGTSYAGGFCSNMELRDTLVAFFVTHLPQGTHEIRYNCRAETPGVFHTMPTTGYAMYFPPLRANSDELVLKVVDVSK